MNLRTWNSLPADVQEILVSVGRQKGLKTLAMAKSWEARFVGEMEKEGATVTTLETAEREKIKAISREVWAAWAKNNGKDAKRLLRLNVR
jgi:TRAP-type C4-dicarboxylate transport system substrate-binding protein